MSCANVKYRISAQREGERKVTGGPRSLAPTCPPPDSSTEIPRKLIRSSVVRLEHPHFSMKPKNSSVLTCFLPGLRKQQKISIEHVKIWWWCVQCSVSRCLHLLSPPRGEPSPPLSPSPTHAPPPAPSPGAPIGRLPPLTSRRHSRHCRPRTENSLPRGCPRGRGKTTV